MLTARKEAPARLLTAAELRRSGSVRKLVLAGPAVTEAADKLCMVPPPAIEIDLMNPRFGFCD